MTETEELQARVASLEAKFGALEDERQIRELLAEYGYTADTTQDEQYIGLWTDDGVMDLESDTLKKVIRYEGRARLREFIANPNGHHDPKKYTNRMHVQGNNLQCRIQGDEAVVTSYSIVLLKKGDQVIVDGAGNNLWRLRKIDGRWRIRERKRRAIGTEEFLRNLAAR